MHQLLKDKIKRFLTAANSLWWVSSFLGDSVGWGIETRSDCMLSISSDQRLGFILHHSRQWTLNMVTKVFYKLIAAKMITYFVVSAPHKEQKEIWFAHWY